MEDICYSNLKMELIATKAKAAMYSDYINLLKLSTWKVDKSFSRDEIISYLQNESLSRDNRYMNDIEINRCLGFIGVI
jgi:hypothetical protein